MEQKLMQEHLANGCLNAPIEIKQFEIVLRKYQNDDFLDKVNSLEQGVSMDGLIQPEDLYITNYITLTSNGQEYLLNLMDYSEFSHTEDFLAKEIEQTLILNGSKQGQFRKLTIIAVMGIEEIVNLNGPIFDTSEITVINKSISERRIEAINYVAEDIAEEFLVGLEDI
nr:13722_t:CDS:2 [Entrophospora candida]